MKSAFPTIFCVERFERAGRKNHNNFWQLCGLADWNVSGRQWKLCVHFMV